ncbi:Mif2/CENP-C like-domain-containing protein [Mycena amicta]|nr:Mif2/CENP-C like-domain-containing protein [Mycena amicta]
MSATTVRRGRRWGSSTSVPGTKAHVPYRGEDPFVGRRTGIDIQPGLRNSDGFEDFDHIMDEQYGAVEASRPKKRKKKQGRKNDEDGEEDDDDDDDDDEDGEMSMDVDSPVQNIRVPTTPRQGRPSSQASRKLDVDFDEVPSPRPLATRRSTPGPSPLKRSVIPPALNAKEFLAQDEGDSDDGNGPAGGYDDYGDNDDDDGPREMSFTEMNAQPDDDDDLEIPEAPILSSSPRKGKRKAPPVEDDDDDMEDEIAMGMQDVDRDLPPSDEDDDDDQSPPPLPPKKKAKPTPQEDEPLSPQQPRSPPKKKTKTKPDKPKNDVVKSRGQKENRDVPEGVRRSKRMPIPPLEWWRLEKYEYGPREENEGSGPLLVPHIRAIVRVPKEPVVPLGGAKRRRRRASSSTPAPPKGKGKVQIVEKIVEVHVDTANPEEGWDDETDTQALVNGYPNGGEQVMRRIAFTAKMFNPTTAGNNQWQYQRIFGDGDFIAAGQIVIPPNGRKPAKPSKDNTFIFFVIAGAVNLKVCETTLIVATGGMFMIPRGNTYFIENIAERDAKLFFTQARKMREGEAVDDVGANANATAAPADEVVVSTGPGKPLRAVSLADRPTLKEKGLRRGVSHA